MRQPKNYRELKDWYPDIFKHVDKYRNERYSRPLCDIVSYSPLLKGGFDWCSSPEGHRFWNNCIGSGGNIENYYKRFPKSFDKDNFNWATEEGLKLTKEPAVAKAKLVLDALEELREDVKNRHEEAVAEAEKQIDSLETAIEKIAKQ